MSARDREELKDIALVLEEVKRSRERAVELSQSLTELGDRLEAMLASGRAEAKEIVQITDTTDLGV